MEEGERWASGEAVFKRNEVNIAESSAIASGQSQGAEGDIGGVLPEL